MTKWVTRIGAAFLAAPASAKTLRKAIATAFATNPQVASAQALLMTAEIAVGSLAVLRNAEV